MHYVYHLVDPRTRVVRYVGKTTQPNARLRTHIKESLERQNTEKKKWIHELHLVGLKPIMVTADQAPDEPTCRILESQHCHRHRATILNIHDPAKGAKDLKTQPLPGTA